MNRKTALLGVALLWLAGQAGYAVAQGTASAASAPPRAGMGDGMRGWRMARDNTPGWSMMTRAERRDHHDKMMSMTDAASCRAYMAQHHARMVERAKDKGRPMPDKARDDACDRLMKKK